VQRVNPINAIRHLPPIGQPNADIDATSPQNLDRLNNSTAEDDLPIGGEEQKIDYEQRNLDKLKAI